MPGTLLLDSDILIDHLRKEQKALAYLTLEIDAGSLLFISVVSRTEILSGARKDEEQTIHGLFDIVTPIDVDVAIADKAGEYLQKFRKGYAHWDRRRPYCRHGERDRRRAGHSQYQALSDERFQNHPTVLTVQNLMIQGLKFFLNILQCFGPS